MKGPFPSLSYFINHEETELIAAAGNPQTEMDSPLFPACLEGVESVGVDRDSWLYQQWDLAPDHVIECRDTSTAVAHVVAQKEQELRT
jgi:hypothetical protein